MNEEHPTADDYRNRAERAERQCEELMAENERLRDRGIRLASYAGHDDDCQIMVVGVLGDPIPCTCGYTEAWQTWMASGDADQ